MEQRLTKQITVSSPCFYMALVFLVVMALVPNPARARIRIDINAPSIQRIQIAIPDFKIDSADQGQAAFAADLPAVIANDLDLSGYFRPIEKSAFLEKGDSNADPASINFKSWSIIGAELLLKGGYVCTGHILEVEARLYDVFSGRMLFGKRFLGKSNDYRRLMHRISSEILYALTGHQGIFLSKLAFVDNSTGHKEIFISDYDGQNLQRITSDRSIALLPKWSPDGNRLLYSSYREGGPKLYLKDLGSNNEKCISSREGLNIGGAWAPGGKTLAVTLSHGDNPDIYKVDLTGKILRRLTNHWAIDVSPTFSPRGDLVAFVSNRSGSPQIYTLDLDSGAETRLTFEGTYNTSPSWSSGNKIAFTGSNNGHFQIFTMNSDGTDLRQLTDLGNNEDPCWSPDGRYIMFSSNRDGGYRLYLMNANGQNQRRIFFKEGEQTAPSWGP